jgi:hypothetical protein
MAVLEQLESLSDERFLTIYETLSEQGFGPLDAQVAKALNFRPHAIRKLPIAQRARHGRRILATGGDAEACYEMFGRYLVLHRKELVVGFLDATGVKHEDGMIEDLDATTPDASKIDGAVSELDGKFEPEDVTLYLALCTEMWPGVEGLTTAWRGRTGATAE